MSEVFTRQADNMVPIFTVVGKWGEKKTTLYVKSLEKGGKSHKNQSADV